MLKVRFPTLVSELTREIQFWSDYHFESKVKYGSEAYQRYAPLNDDPIRLSFHEGAEMIVYAGIEGLFAEFAERGRSQPVEMGRDDGFRPFPHCLRWAELDLLGRAIALSEPSLRHPGIFVALLARLAPITDDKDAEHAVPLLESAFRSLIKLDARAFQHLLRHFDHRAAHFRWENVQGYGWSIHQSREARDVTGIPLYTERSAGGGFPNEAFRVAIENLRVRFGESLKENWFVANEKAILSNALVAAEKRNPPRLRDLSRVLESSNCPFPALIESCRSGDEAQGIWALEFLLNLEPGALSSHWFGPTPYISIPVWSLSLTLPALRRNPSPESIVERLDQALSANNEGSARISGWGADDTGTMQLAMVTVTLNGSFDIVFARMLRVLRDAKASQHTEVAWFGPELKKNTLKQLLNA